MKMTRAYWLTTAACVLALAACKKSSSTSGTAGTGGDSTGTAGMTATAGTTGTAGKPTGTAGTTGTAGKAGGTAGSTGGTGGMSAGAMAKATITTFGTGNMVTGSATLTQSGTDVTIKIDIMGCVDGKSYPVHIHTGTACTDATTQGGHWGAPPATGTAGAGGSGGAGGASGAGGAGGAGGASGAGGATAAKIYRGEGIPAIMCVGTMGTTTLTRKNTDPLLTWSIGGDMTTDVVGHVIVVHAPDMPTMPARIACGPITKS